MYVRHSVSAVVPSSRGRAAEPDRLEVANRFVDRTRTRFQVDLGPDTNDLVATVGLLKCFPSHRLGAVLSR